MKIGMITCNYFMRIYNYVQPEPFDWGVMCKKFMDEFDRAEFIKLAKEIREMGYDCLEIWEPTFSYRVYSDAQATELAKELAELGFRELVYCIGGWGKNSVSEVEPAYRFAKALGAKVVTGCITLADVDIIFPEVDKMGKKYGLLYAIENHPLPSIEKPQDVFDIMQKYETIGANLDTGIYNMQGYDVVEAAKLLKEKIFHVHFKDTKKGTKDGCLPIGDGDAPMAEVLKLLKEWNYGYLVSVEFEYPTDPAPGLIKSLAYIKANL